MTTRDRTVALPDGRVLGLAERGPADGFPIVHLHGTPAARHLGLVTRRTDVRLLDVERPGVGASTRRPGRRVADWADDARALLDALGIERAAVVGTSAGGPYALACGALLADRTVAVALRSSVGQRFDRPDLDEHQTEDLRWLLPQVRADVAGTDAALPDLLRPRAQRWHDDPDRFWREHLDELGPADRAAAVAGEGAWRADLAAAFADPDGYCDEIAANLLPWGFDPADVAVPVRAWHCAGDPVAPLAVLRATVEVAGGEVLVHPGDAHHPPTAWGDEIVDWLRRA